MQDTDILILNSSLWFAADEFEITDDNYYDLLVKLNGINNSKANLTISYLHELIQTLLKYGCSELEDPFSD